MSDANRDQNFVPIALGQSSTSATTTLPFKIDSSTGRLLVDTASGSGTVTSVSVVSANGFAGSVANATTTPAITLTTTINAPVLAGNGTAISAATTTGSGSTVVLATGPTLSAPLLGTPASGTLTNCTGLPIVAGTTGTLTLARGGTGLTTIAALSIWVANSADALTALTPGAGNSIRVNGAGNAWEAFTPSSSVPTTITVADESTDATCFLAFFTAATGDLGPKTNANLTFNSSTGVATFGQTIVGSISGTAAVGTAVTVADEATDTTCFITFVTAATGNLGVKSNTNMTFNSNTGVATFASTVLTTTDINGGTIDGVTIGGASAGAITGTTITANTGFLPDTDGGAYLGQPTQAFTHLYLDTTATINFDNGNAVITHSSAVLTVSTGDFRITTAGTNSASAVTVGGTQTLTSKTLTSPTITTATLSGHQTYAENAALLYDPVLSADGTYNGEVRGGTAGAALAFGDLVYLDPTDSRWELADANSASAADGDARGILGICVLAAAGDGSATTVLLRGIVRADTAFPALTVNAPIYVSETAGDITTTIPTTSGAVQRAVGFGWTADELYFCPNTHYQTAI